MEKELEKALNMVQENWESEKKIDEEDLEMLKQKAATFAVSFFQKIEIAVGKEKAKEVFDEFDGAVISSNAYHAALAINLALYKIDQKYNDGNITKMIREERKSYLS